MVDCTSECHFREGQTSLLLHSLAGRAHPVEPVRLPGFRQMKAPTQEHLHDHGQDGVGWRWRVTGDADGGTGRPRKHLTDNTQKVPEMSCVDPDYTTPLMGAFLPLACPEEQNSGLRLTSRTLGQSGTLAWREDRWKEVGHAGQP